MENRDNYLWYAPSPPMPHILIYDGTGGAKMPTGTVYFVQAEVGARPHESSISMLPPDQSSGTPGGQDSLFKEFCCYGCRARAIQKRSPRKSTIRTLSTSCPGIPSPFSIHC
jgi:hypothetical protein